MKNLDKLHTVHLEIADELHRICVKHDIDYFMSAGSMLGAVRHKGFIPWDDDFDTGMTRENYDRFLEVVEKEISDDFYYISLDNNLKYSLRYIKLMKKHTRLDEAANPKDIENYGIFIDIFVFDKVPNNNLLKLHHNVSVEIFQKLLYAKAKNQLNLNESIIKRNIYKILQIVVKPLSRKWLIKSLKNSMTRYNNIESEFLTNTGEYFANYNNEMISVSMTKNLKLYTFENRQYYGFEDYETYLTNLYGDWRTLPHIDNRVPHHSYLYVNFDTRNND